MADDDLDIEAMLEAPYLNGVSATLQLSLLFIGVSVRFMYAFIQV